MLVPLLRIYALSCLRDGKSQHQHAESTDGHRPEPGPPQLGRQSRHIRGVQYKNLSQFKVIIRLYYQPIGGNWLDDMYVLSGIAFFAIFFYCIEKDEL